MRPAHAWLSLVGLLGEQGPTPFRQVRVSVSRLAANDRGRRLSARQGVKNGVVSRRLESFQDTVLGSNDAMQQFITKHQRDTIGVLSGFDRIRFRGTIRMLAYAEGLLDGCASAACCSNTSRRSQKGSRPR